MIRRSVKFQLVAFALIVVAGVAYVGANYVGISVPGHGPYDVTVYLHNTGGLYPNADVSERGVVVGKVASIGLVKTPAGREQIKATLQINHGVQIPAGTPGKMTRAKVADLSAVGEQYIELEPEVSGSPWLGTAGHESIAADLTETPLDIGKEVLDLNKLLTSVNTRQLSVVIKQLGVGFDHLGPILSHLIQNGDALTKAAIATLPSQLSLINDGVKVLNTQNSVASEFKSYAKTFKEFTASLDQDDSSIKAVFKHGVPAAEQLSSLLSRNAPVLPTLFDNLITFQGIQAVRLPDIQAVLELYPADTSAGFLITPGDGLARFGDVMDNSAKTNPCGFAPNTDGYVTPNSASSRANNDPGGWGGDLDLSSYCHGKGIDRTLRGARNVPILAPGRPNITGKYTGKQNPATLAKERRLECPEPYTTGLCGKASSGTGGKKSSPSAHSLPSGVIGDGAGPDPILTSTYNPRTGLVEGLNGKKYLLGYDGPTAPIFGSNSWTWLLAAPSMK